MNTPGTRQRTGALKAPTPGTIITQLEKLVDRERFLHSLGTYHTMLILCQEYREDPYEGAVLGLIHDSGRCLEYSRIRERLEEFQNPLSEEDLAFPKLWHARLGAVMLERTFGIKNREMAEAIRVHPTGSPGMSRIGRILFIADYIEPTRDFDGVERYRNLAFSDRDEAFRAILKSKIDHVRSMGKSLHSDSLKALNFYFKEGEKAY
jgi:predicted HD superfamily hydrolase involved in NAD metabolism